MAAFDPMSIPLVLSPETMAGQEGDLGWHQSCLLQAMLDAGFDWAEVPADLRAMFALGYYIGNVENGGHAQFIGNAYGYYGAGPLRMLDWATEAAARFGLVQTQAVLADARAWVIAHPDEAAQQTGMTGGRDVALDPLDKAFNQADLVSEADWLAVLEPLGPEVAGALARGQFYQHADYPLRFPVAAFANHQAVALLARQPQRIVAKDAVLATTVQLVRDLPGGRAQVLAKTYPEVLQRLPNVLDCTVFDALEKAGFWQGGGPNDGLSLGQNRPGPAGQTYAAMLDGKLVYVLAKTLSDGTVTLHSTTGSPVSVGQMVRLPERKPAPGIWAKLRRYFDAEDQKQRLLRQAIAKHSARSAISAVDEIGRSTLANGQLIADMMKAQHVAEAVTLHLFAAGESNFVFRRLLRWSVVAEKGTLDWLLTSMKDKPFEMQVRPDGVMFRAPGEDSVTRYPMADLQALRAQMAAVNLSAQTGAT